MNRAAVRPTAPPVLAEGSVYGEEVHLSLLSHCWMLSSAAGSGRQSSPPPPTPPHTNRPSQVELNQKDLLPAEGH